jgi:UDP:flavonoid glycosyltransferase YjiC (YdhE family)
MKPAARPGASTLDRTPDRALLVASSGGGGDHQPLLALAAGLLARGIEVAAFGDAEIDRLMRRIGVDTFPAGAEHDLALHYAAVAREDGHLPAVAQAERLRDRLAGSWAPGLAPLVEAAARTHGSSVLVASLFSAGPARLAAERAGLRWAAVNSTFYIGPSPPRSLEEDFGPRAPLFGGYFAPNMDAADCVLHATDQAFDFGFSGAPAHHHYVGPLLDQASGEHPAWLDAPGPPWALVTVSSLKQDDVLIARAALEGLADLPLRVLVTIGPHGGQDLGPVPPNARVERHVPHGPVLDRARLVVSHAGHGSVMRAMWHGVPTVLLPWGRDQGGVAARAAQLGVARVVARSEISAARLAEDARAVLADRGMAERVGCVCARLQASDPVGKAVGLVVGLASDAGARGHPVSASADESGAGSESRQLLSVA